MATVISFNGTTYTIPAEGDSSWGTNVSNYLIAISTAVLQKSGGSFVLTAELDFGNTYGIKTAYVKSTGTNPSSGGVIRLANNESVSWRNAANSGDLGLKLSASDWLQFNAVNLADISTAQTLTNKTMSGASNTFSNIGYSSLSLGTSIVNGDISASAAIALTKLATVTASKALVSDGSGNISASGVSATTLGYLDATSSVQTQLDAKVAKTLTTTTGDMIYASSANTPARLAIGSSGQVIKSVGGVPTWATFSGGINYLSSNPDAESDTTGWATYADAAGTSPVDGTAGSANVTWTRTTSSPLRGSGSFLFTRTAANRQGEGVSYDFTIDTADKAKVLQVEFDYLLASGAFTAGSSSTDSELTVWLYDVTNSVLIQPSTYKLYTSSSSIPDKFIGNFQTASNSTSYRLIIHCGSTTATAFTMQFDNFKVGPCSYVYGTPIKDWIDYPMVITSSGAAPTVGTTTTNKARWRRVGDTMELSYSLVQTGVGTAGTGYYKFSLPSGYSADSNKVLVGNNNVANVGACAAYNGSTSVLGVTQLIDANNLIMTSTSDISAPNQINASFYQLSGASIQYGFTAAVPILGWSSSVQQSDGYDGRLIAATYRTSADVTIGTSNADVVWNTKIDDGANIMNTSTGVVTVPSAGKYAFNITGRLDTGGSTPGEVQFALIVTGRNAGTYVLYDNSVFTTSKIYPLHGSIDLEMNAGDTAKINAVSTTNSSTLKGGSSLYTNFNIKKLSSPTTISATETVAARYTSSAGQSIANASSPIVDFETKDYDTHGAVTTGANWKFTAPIAGLYSVKTLLRYGNTLAWTAGQYVSTLLYKKGSSFSTQDTLMQATVTPAQAPSASLVDTVQLNAGDYIDIRTAHGESAARALVASGTLVRVTIEKIK